MTLDARYVPENRGFSTPCWIWRGLTNYDGYPRIQLGPKEYRVHRLMWSLKHGRIPAGHHIHHGCEVALCVNPDHLELVAPSDHARIHNPSRRRLTHCKRGHALTEDNVVWYDGYRKCRACRSLSDARAYRRKKDALAQEAGV